MSEAKRKPLTRGSRKWRAWQRARQAQLAKRVRAFIAALEAPTSSLENKERSEEQP